MAESYLLIKKIASEEARNPNLVPAEGLEPPTLCSEDRCSNPLSYAGLLNNRGNFSIFLCIKLGGRVKSIYMAKISPQEKLELKRGLWAERTAEALSISANEAVELLSTERRQSIRINTLKADVSETISVMEQLGWQGEAYSWMPEGFTLEAGREQLRDSELAANGDIYIQNAASWLAVLALDPKPGDKVLDVCAAPGGKTSHIAAVTNNEAVIIANDNSRPRLAKLRANCQRLGAGIESFTLFDASNITRKLEGEQFDKILIDAPCSGEGMMNYKKDKDFETWSVAKVNRLQGLQKRILRQAYQLLKPGGTLVYSTCTIAPEENEAVVNYALKNFESIALQSINCEVENRVSAVRQWNGREFSSEVMKCLRLKPSTNIQAFFVAKITKLQ